PPAGRGGGDGTPRGHHARPRWEPHPAAVGQRPRSNGGRGDRGRPPHLTGLSDPAPVIADFWTGAAPPPAHPAFIRRHIRPDARRLRTTDRRGAATSRGRWR